MLSWELEDWITDAGAALVDKRLLTPESLSPTESLVYEIWLLDTEARNGGLSQYFCNNGLARWQKCVAAASHVRSFQPFAHAVERLLANHTDPYQAIRSHGLEGEDLWFTFQPQVVAELKQLSTGAL